MIRNYLKTALRNLWKNKTYSFINVLGLTLGLVSFMLIALYVFDELTYDRFHKNADHIFRIVETKVSTNQKTTKVAAVAYKIGEQSITTIPEVKKMAQFAEIGRVNVSDPATSNTFYEGFTIANPDFLNVFDFPLLEGNRATALMNPHSVILTEEMAKKIFGVSTVTGRTLKADIDSIPYNITGVLKKFPENSHISFNMLFSASSITSNGFNNFLASDWNSNTFPTYLLLDKEASVEKATEKINQLVKNNRHADNEPASTFMLQPLTAIHFHSEGIDGTSAEKKGNLTYMYAFSIIALFVLMIDCINYMNLTTARFASRGKEIAVRKVAGAVRHNLISQFLSEAFLMAFIALGLAIIVTELILPYFNTFTEKQLSLNGATDYRVWLGVGITVLLVGLFAGAYPALFQSRLKPYLLLKNKVRQTNGQLSLRRGLVVFQFSLSIIMIVATIVVFMQMKFVNTANMGFNKEQLLVIDINSGAVRRGAETIKNEYEKIAAVKSVSVSSRVPGEWKVIPKIKVHQQNAGENTNEMYFMGVDDRFLKTFQIDLLKGRNFSSEGHADSSALVINETAAAMLGITEPSGQLIEVPTVDFNGDVRNLDATFTGRVVGITKDFNFQSMREKIGPLVMGYQTNPIQAIDYFTIRLNTTNVDQTIAQLGSVLHTVDASHLFEYNFLDKKWDIFYREDQKRQTIFLFTSILTILIACLGLFGLATYAAEQRIKEIGIRKVLGASMSQLITMLSADFIKLVLVASVIAIPVAWWMMNNWLHDFAYRTKIYWWVFAIAAALALAIALFTVGLKAMKAALSNPVKSLRAE